MQTALECAAAAELAGMNVQIIHLHGQPVALVIGEEAIIPDQLTGDARIIVAAKAHYALQIAAGERAGPYSDRDAEEHAEQLRATARRRARRVGRRRWRRRERWGARREQRALARRRPTSRPRHTDDLWGRPRGAPA